MPLFDIVLIETHNICTRRCWFCKFGQERQDDQQQFLPDNLIAKIAEELGSLNFAGRISPFGINEPLLDPRLLNIIQLFRSKCPDAYLSFNTNGDRLTETVYHELIGAGLDALGISIYDDLAARRLSHYGEYSNVALIDMRQPEGKIENRGGQVKLNAELFQPARVQPISCLRPFHMLVIRPTGDVVLCCADMYGDVVMGNIQDQSLIEIWESEQFQAYRTKLAQEGRASLELCQDCSHNGIVSPLFYPFHQRPLLQGASTR